MIIQLQIIFLLHILCIQCEKITDPTLKPAQPFSANNDGDTLRKELKKSWFPNRDKIAKIWFRRTYDQRNQIKEYYETKFCQGMSSSPEGSYSNPVSCPLSTGFSDVSLDNLDDLYLASLQSSQEILGRAIFDVIMGDCREVGTIEEVVCGNDKEIKDLIAGTYKAHSKTNIEDDLRTVKLGDKDYERVILQYCWKGFCQQNKIKPEDAAKESQALRAIDPNKDKDAFKKKLDELLDKNCEPDLKLIFEKYRNDKDGIHDAVDKVFDRAWVKRAYNYLVRYIEDTCKFYADELQRAVHGLKTMTDKINRIFLTRCERDLGCILLKYQQIHNKSFMDRLIMETLSEPRYRHCLGYLGGK